MRQIHAKVWNIKKSAMLGNLLGEGGAKVTTKTGFSASPNQPTDRHPQQAKQSQTTAKIFCLLSI